MAAADELAQPTRPRVTYDYRIGNRPPARDPYDKPVVETRIAPTPAVAPQPNATLPGQVPATQPANPTAAAAGIIERPGLPAPTQFNTLQPTGAQRQAAQQLAAPIMADSRAVLEQSGADASRAVDRGAYGSAAGHVLRGTAALVPAAVADIAGPAVRLAAPVVQAGAEAVGTFLTGQDAQAQTAPGGTTPPKPARPGSPGKPSAAQALAGGAGAGGGRGGANPPAAGQPIDTSTPQLTGARGSTAGTAVAGAPGVRRLTAGDGRTLYSNVPGAADNDQLMSGSPGVQVVPGGGAGGRGGGAADTLARSIDPALQRARAEAVARGDIDAVRASYGGDFANGLGGGQPDAAGMLAGQIQSDLSRGARITRAGAGAITDVARVQQSGQANQLAATRLAAELPGMAADTSLKASQARAAQDLEAGRAALAAAATPEAKAQATDYLRALQGKYEREYPELFATSVLPGQVDALGNKTPGVAVVTDKRTGRVQMYDQSGAAIQPGAAAAAAPLPPKDQLKAGTTYQTARGPARWDGKQFVPVQAAAQ